MISGGGAVRSPRQPCRTARADRRRTITRPVRGQPKQFTGRNYLQQFIIPNLYFHTTAAYLILRHNGVDIGKADFIGPLD